MQESLSKNVDYGEVVVRYKDHIVRELPYSRNNLYHLWLSVKRHKNLANKELREDFKSFVEIFLEGNLEDLKPRGLVWVVNDFAGLFILNNITNVEATVHIAILNRKVEDPNISKEMLKFAFSTFKFHRLNAEVPVYVRPQFFDFVKSVGFIEEGNKRKCVWFDNKWFDMRLYGLLNTEILGAEAL